MVFERVGKVLAMVIISLTISSTAYSASMSLTPGGKGRPRRKPKGMPARSINMRHSMS